MKLTSVQIANYKCFSDSGPIPIGPSCTVIVGQNNSGKTAFLETLAMGRLEDKPHREPQRGAYPFIPIPGFRMKYEATLSGAELEYLIRRDGNQVFIPVENGAPDVRAKEIFSNPKLNFKLNYSRAHGWVSDVSPSHQLFPMAVAPIRVGVARAKDSSELVYTTSNNVENLPGKVGAWLQQSIYVFRAERLNVGESDIGPSSELLPDASNLPSCLLHLPGNTSAYHHYTEYVREVFPTIFGVAASPMSERRARIAVTMSHMLGGVSTPGVEVSLTDSGTGVSQVLALLYVAITAPAPRIIVIDEPNSFLHPGATKKLLSILRRFDHQYIISTHSPDVIRVLDPEYLHLFEWNGLSTSVHTMNGKNVSDQRQVLLNLGVSLSDVFGSDSVLWVEGPTEAACFPLLIQDLKVVAAASIVPLVATGDLETKNKPRAALIWELYQQLSSGSALIPPALAFSLDKEGRSQKEIDDLVRRSGGAVKFLPRSTYENYLLDADALSALLSEEAKNDISPERVLEWLNVHPSRKAFRDEDNWIANVNGAKIVAELFAELSRATVEYRKTIHSVALTKWLLSHKHGVLAELLGYIKDLFGGRTQEGTG